MFRNGITDREDHAGTANLIELRPMVQNITPFDEKTLGGNVDFDKFWQILDMIDTSGGQ